MGALKNGFKANSVSEPFETHFFKATSFALGESVRLARVLEARWSDWARVV